MEIDLKGKTVLLTGATGGIGESAARFFAGAGARMVLHYRSDSSKAKKLLESLPPVLGGHRLMQADFSKLESIHGEFDTLEREGVFVDILINNAGFRNAKDFLEIDEHQLVDTFAVNFFAPFVCAQRVFRMMKEKGGGRIIFVTSVDGEKAGAKRADYGPSKAAEINLVKNLALELAPYGVLVNAVSPGAISTAMTKPLEDNAEMLKHVLNGIPLNRLGRSEEVASMLLFLCSKYSDYTTGSIATIDGGITLKRGY